MGGKNGVSFLFGAGRNGGMGLLVRNLEGRAALGEGGEGVGLVFIVLSHCLCSLSLSLSLCLSLYV